ncbi:MAG: hypothetical protein GEU93_08710 [Propionibacteriales bacterium]|nr:hypothetical protein [Propionibacteriales bacterium]
MVTEVLGRGFRVASGVVWVGVLTGAGGVVVAGSGSGALDGCVALHAAIVSVSTAATPADAVRRESPTTLPL